MKRPTPDYTTFDPEALFRRPLWRRLFNLVLLTAAIFLPVGLFATYLQSSRPPSRFTLVTGLKGSGSHLAAENYQRIAREKGFEIEIVPVDDVRKRVDMLLGNEVQVGIIPSGGAAGLETDELNTLASVYYEPVWLFYRRALSPDQSIDDLRELRGLRVAPRPGNISTERLGRLLLGMNGLTDDDVTFVDVGREEAIAMLRDGSLDAAFFAGAATEELVLPLLREPALDIVDLRRAAAYANRYRFMTVVTLPEGAVDLQTDLPHEDKQLLSTVANIVIRSDLHPDLIRLLTIAVVETHEPGGLFEKPFEFPNLLWADLEVSREYLAYLERIRNGESALDNLLPFRLAAVVDRIYLFAIPFLLLLIPVVSRSPAVYNMFMRRRLNSWYQLLRDIEKRAAYLNLEQLVSTEWALDEMEHRLEENFSISTAYLAGYYDLRMHIALVRGEIRKRRLAMESAAAKDKPSAEAETSERGARVPSAV